MRGTWTGRRSQLHGPEVVQAAVVRERTACACFAQDVQALLKPAGAVGERHSECLELVSQPADARAEQQPAGR